MIQYNPNCTMNDRHKKRWCDDKKIIKTKTAVTNENKSKIVAFFLSLSLSEMVFFICWRLTKATFPYMLHKFQIHNCLTLSFIYYHTIMRNAYLRYVFNGKTENEKKMWFDVIGAYWYSFEIWLKGQNVCIPRNFH